jgi:hypothetical protein
MATRRRSDDEQPTIRRAPAKTPIGRENQMVSLAVDLAEKQMREGTASAQVISHYLKLGSSREQLEQQRLAAENELLKAKVEAMAAEKRMEELYVRAINAMRSYSGQTEIEAEVEYDD